MTSELSKLLRERRGDRSLRDFAEYLDISHANLDQLEKAEHGEIRLTARVMMKLGKALGLSYIDIHKMSGTARDFQKYRMEISELENKPKIFDLSDIISSDIIYTLKDNSMIHEGLDIGDQVKVTSKGNIDDISNGALVLTKKLGTVPTVRRLWKIDKYIVLQAGNVNYPPSVSLMVDNIDIVLGVVTEITRRVK